MKSAILEGSNVIDLDMKSAILEGSNVTDLDMSCFTGQYVTGTVTPNTSIGSRRPRVVRHSPQQVST